MIKRYMKVVLTAICLVVLSNSMVFAGTMDDLLLNGVANNDMDLVRTALSNGANINCIKNEYTPLIYAIESKSEDMTYFLLKNGADPNFKVVTWDKRNIIPIH